MRVVVVVVAAAVVVLPVVTVVSIVPVVTEVVRRGDGSSVDLNLRGGDAVNLEFDMIGKFVRRLVEPYRDASRS